MTRNVLKKLAWIGGLFSSIALVLGLLADGKDALQAIRDLQNWGRDDAAITGTWTSSGEGFVDAAEWANKSASNVVWLSVEVEEGVITGSIHNPRMCAFLPWKYVQFEGSNTWWGTTGLAYDFVGGEKVAVSTFDLEIDDKGFLVLTPTSASPVFPTVVRLAKTNENPERNMEGVPHLCQGIMDELLKRRQRGGPVKE
jgi:hypothetical protein